MPIWTWVIKHPNGIFLIDTGGNAKVTDKDSFLTETKNLIWVHTPGHTSVCLKTDQGYLYFAGNVVYYEQQLLNNQFAGANVSHSQAQATYDNIKRFAQQYKMIPLLR